MEKILCLRYATVFPADLLDGFCVAVSRNSYKLHEISTDALKLFKCYSHENDCFLGTCWAFIYGNKYYLYFIGSKEICLANEDEFILKETDEIIAPLRHENGISHILRCKYIEDKTSCRVVAQTVDEVSTSNYEPIKTLHIFEDNVTFDSALCFYYCNFCK